MNSQIDLYIRDSKLAEKSKKTLKKFFDEYSGNYQPCSAQITELYPGVFTHVQTPYETGIMVIGEQNRIFISNKTLEKRLALIGEDAHPYLIESVYRGFQIEKYATYTHLGGNMFRCTANAGGYFHEFDLEITDQIAHAVGIVEYDDHSCSCANEHLSVELIISTKCPLMNIINDICTGKLKIESGHQIQSIESQTCIHVMRPDGNKYSVVLCNGKWIAQSAHTPSTSAFPLAKSMKEKTIAKFSAKVLPMFEDPIAIACGSFTVSLKNEAGCCQTWLRTEAESQGFSYKFDALKMQARIGWDI